MSKTIKTKGYVINHNISSSVKSLFDETKEGALIPNGTLCNISEKENKEEKISLNVIYKSLFWILEDEFLLLDDNGEYLIYEVDMEIDNDIYEEAISRIFTNSTVYKTNEITYETYVKYILSNIDEVSLVLLELRNLYKENTILLSSFECNVFKNLIKFGIDQNYIIDAVKDYANSSIVLNFIDDWNKK